MPLFVTDVGVFGRVDVDRIAFQAAYAVEDTLALLAEGLACGSGTISLDVGSDVVAVFDGRGVVGGVGDGGRVAVGVSVRIRVVVPNIGVSDFDRAGVGAVPGGCFRYHGARGVVFQG